MIKGHYFETLKNIKYFSKKNHLYVEYVIFLFNIIHILFSYYEIKKCVFLFSIFMNNFWKHAYIQYILN